MLQTYYVWEWPVRITHWITFICVVVLGVTGLGIGTPFLEPALTAPYSMGWMRFVHIVFGYLFTLSVVSRIIWMFIGNRHASWKNFVAVFTRKGWQSGYKAFKYYSFLSPRTPYEIGHNGLAATAYAGVFMLLLAEIITGLALYGQYAPGGAWHRLFSPLLILVGNQYLRLIHHGILWLLVSFTIIHVYLSFMLECKMRNGLISSIFGGYKTIETDKLNR
ncbi:MAG: Ni/Fe-hydrogenase, b-type cytochrome subunit [Desulfuromonadaceae bacterium]|nr:Ni/Fe-hydrogenase, b-type cytochrome subunit [Desulfuromonadaceae bacterium]